MKEILLHDGSTAIVDEQDYEWLNQFHWTRAKYPMTRWSVPNKYGMDHKTPVCMHTIIMNRVGVKDGLQVDHINRDKMDNRRANLRVVTKSANLKNKMIHRSNNRKSNCEATDLMGVSKDRAYWRAQIYINGENHNLGIYQYKEDAAIVYNVAVQLFGLDRELNAV